MLRQCSRDTPPPGESGWAPARADVAAFEARLPAALPAAVPHRDWSGFPGKWHGQYVGIVRKGRRVIYGNFVPGGLPPGRGRPIIICDGGPSVVGAEYDMADKRITHLAFNGMT